MRAIVTGAAGFLGSALCRTLAESGAFVTAVVRESSDTSALLGDPRINVVACAMDEYGKLPLLVADECDVFFHFAWSGVSSAERGSATVQVDNLAATAAAVHACAQLGCSRFAFASSIIEYEALAAVEARVPLGPSMVYGIAKHGAAQLAKALTIELGIEYVGLLITNVFGVGEKSARLIISSIGKLLDGEQCKFSPGDQMYDFVYVDDAVRAMMSAAKDGMPGREYYIGGGDPHPLKVFLERMRDIVSPAASLQFGALPPFPVTVDYGMFDVQALASDTGYRPAVGFDEGIRRTADWLRDARR